MNTPASNQSPAEDQPGDAQAPLDSKKYASRSGLKLEAALDAFGLEVADLTAADFGCNVGGFTDCLLKRDIKKVYAVDTGYGALAWRLRKDPRVVVMERTNALHADCPEPVDLVVIDVAWTPQRLILPAARRWLRPGGRVVTLIKPHYEHSDAAESGRGRRGRGRPSERHVLSPEAAAATLDRTLAAIAEAGWTVAGHIPSPLTGTGGNMEYLALLHA